MSEGRRCTCTHAVWPIGGVRVPCPREVWLEQEVERLGEERDGWRFFRDTPGERADVARLVAALRDLVEACDTRGDEEGYQLRGAISRAKEVLG